MSRAKARGWNIVRDKERERDSERARERERERIDGEKGWRQRTMDGLAASHYLEWSGSGGWQRG